MPRPKLNMTPEERKVHDRESANARKRKQRKKVAELKIVTMTSELEEFADEILSLPLQTASMALAIWQKENKQKFPDLPMPEQMEGEQWADFIIRRDRRPRFGLIRIFATTAIARDKARERKKRFDFKEAQEAAKLGMTTDAFRRHKRGQQLAQEIAEIVANRAA